MVGKYSIWYSALAKEDLQEIYRYIQTTDSRIRAQYVLNGITESIGSIAIFPTKHRVDPLFNSPNIRFSVKWKYKILFRIGITKIEILRIFHASQDPQKLIL